MAAAATTPYPSFWKNVGSRPAPRRPGVVADQVWAPGERPLRVVIVGKGGAGKSVIAGTMARILARRGRKVLALDTDTLPGLALSLGAESADTPPLAAAVDKVGGGCWRLKKGIGPVRAVQRYSTPAPDGVRVLELGDQAPGGDPPLTPSVHAFYQVVHALPEARALKDWTMVGDHPAGPRQTAHDWAPYADTLLLVTEPSWKSALTARRVADIGEARGSAILPIASKIEGPGDVSLVEQILGREVAASVPADEAVAATDRRGVALIDYAPQSEAVKAIESLVDGLVDGTRKGMVHR